MIEPQDLYSVYVESFEEFLPEAPKLPTWAELSWPLKDEWQERADELNEARREDA